MKVFIRSALLGAAGFALLAVPAYAQRSYDPSAGTVGYTSGSQKMAQRPYDPSAGTVGYKRTKQQVAERPYDPSAGSVGFKKKKKKAKKN